MSIGAGSDGTPGTTQKKSHASKASIKEETLEREEPVRSTFSARPCVPVLVEN